MTGVVLESEILPGSYVCVRTKTFLGWLVRVACKSPYDHALIYLGDGAICEATAYGVRLGELSAYRGQLAVANAAEPMTARQRDQVKAAALGMRGDEYGWGDDVVIGLRRMGLRWAWLAQAGVDRAARICSELVAMCGQAAGLDWLCGESDPAFVTPAELAARPGVVPIAWNLQP